MSLTKFRGGAELQKTLKELPEKLARNVLRSGLRAGANVIRDQAKANINPETGAMQTKFKVSTGRMKDGTVYARVRNTDFAARWLEYGTAAHDIAPKGTKSLFFAGLFKELVNHPGTRAKPFMRPAMDTKAGAALVAVGQQMQKRLSKQGIEAGPIELESEDEE